MAVVIRKALKGKGRRAGLYVTSVISALGKLMLEKEGEGEGREGEGGRIHREMEGQGGKF